MAWTILHYNPQNKMKKYTNTPNYCKKENTFLYPWIHPIQNVQSIREQMYVCKYNLCKCMRNTVE